MSLTDSHPDPPIPASLSEYQVPRSTYMTSHPEINGLAVSAYIFSHPPSEPRRLLLLHRSATEPTFPSLWEPPGGGVEDYDATILDALVREVKEETGMTVTKILRRIEGPREDGRHFIPRSLGREGVCERLNFIVEVEMGDVRCDPEEHQGFKWVTLEESEELEMTMGSVRELNGIAFE